MSIAKYIEDSSANFNAFLPKDSTIGETGSKIARAIHFNDAPNVASMFCPASFTYLKDGKIITPNEKNSNTQPKEN